MAEPRFQLRPYDEAGTVGIVRVADAVEVCTFDVDALGGAIAEDVVLRTLAELNRFFRVAP